MRYSLKKAIYVLLPLAAYMIVNDLARYTLAFVMQQIFKDNSDMRTLIADNQALVSGIIAIIAMLIGAYVLLVLMKRDEMELALSDYVNLRGVSFYRADKLHPTWVSYVLIVLQAISAAIGLNALLYLTGLVAASDSISHSDNRYAIPVWLGIILYGFISPGVEELLHRLVIFGRLKRCYPFFVSVLVSALFFGLFHMNLVQIVYGSLMGILMCLAVEYVHSIWGSFLMHSVANLTVYIMSAVGIFSKLGSWSICYVCLAIAIVTLILEMFWTYKSAKEIGIPLGVERVGIFFIDE